MRGFNCPASEAKKEKNMENLLGKTIYCLGCTQSVSHWWEERPDEPIRFNYRIYPIELKLKEIRIGRAETEAEANGHYGVGTVSYLCASKGPIRAFSPVDGELISGHTIAGRHLRGFWDKESLRQEAETLKACVEKNYKNVGSCEICLD